MEQMNEFYSASLSLAKAGSQRQGLGAGATPSSGREAGQLPAGGVMGRCQHPPAAVHKEVQAMGLSRDPGMEGQWLW